MPSRTPPVLQIDHPNSASPTQPNINSTIQETGYFPTRSRTNDRASSAGTSEYASTSSSAPGRKSNHILNTPPISPRPDGLYFSPRSPRSHHKYTRTTSPSDNLSATSYRSPHISSGGSFNTSDTGRSPCSNSSSEYLEPPQGQADTDNPPYKARRQSSNSLTMVRKLGRANTMPDGKKRKRRRHRRHHKSHHKKANLQELKMYEHKEQPYWWLPRCQTVPTAPVGQKELCQGHDALYTPRRSKSGYLSLSDHDQEASNAGIAPQALTRRWSSVEVGAHQIVLDSTRTLPIQRSAPKPSQIRKADDFFSPNITGQPYRSSSFTRGAIDHDIVRTVRERLTLRKIIANQLDDVSPSQLETPSSITLRRASGGGSVSELGSGGRAVPVAGTSGLTTPRACLASHIHQRLPSAAYLITSRDIDYITALIESNLKRRFENGSVSDPNTSSTLNGPDESTKSRSFLGKVLSVTTSFMTDLTRTKQETASDYEEAQDSLKYLQVSEAGTRNRRPSRSNSNKSTHEVIWAGDESPGAYTDDEDERESACSSEPVTPQSPSQRITKLDSAALKDKGDAFDPKNARASISEWSWRLPQNNISVVGTSSDSESNDPSPPSDTPASPARPFVSSSISYPKDKTSSKRKPFNRTSSPPPPPLAKAQNVISFPPLAPRKTTIDWYSPLPNMETSSPLASHRSLHDLGVDASYGPSSSRSVTPKASQRFPVPLSTGVSPSSSQEFKKNQETNYDAPKIQEEYDSRRKSVMRTHPKAPARIRERLAIGSSIGSSHGERRKSSARNPTPRIQRVKTIDNIHKGERDHPSTRWRAPSPCPSPKLPSPSESDNRKDLWIPGPETGLQRLTKLRSGLPDGVDVMMVKSSPAPHVDCSGIYGKLMGATRAAASAPDFCYEGKGKGYESHVCDDCAMDPRHPSVG